MDTALKLHPLALTGNDSQRPLVIAGPCSAETEEQVMTTALALREQGVHLFRAGIWKPRTKPGCFEGVGSKGLRWLKAVKKETGMLVATEVATPHHAAEALKAGIDLLWIGARTVANPFAMQELADALQGCEVPILVKNPVNTDLELWIGALERLNNAGITKLGAIHRGFSSYGKREYRNTPQWHIPIELRRRLPALPLFCDPSHIGGKRELIASLSQQAMDLNYDGLIVECHCRPDKAWSDASQQITPETLGNILRKLVVRNESPLNENLLIYRKQIDECDDELIRVLSKRMSVVQEIGRMKKEHGVTILQTERYNKLLQRLCQQGERYDIDGDFIRKIFEAIHEESIRQQMKIVNKEEDNKRD